MKLQENKSALYDFHWGKGDNMAEMSFAMKYSTLERFSNEIALMSEDFLTICDELRTLVSSVDGEWKGKAHDRFEERYKKLDPKLKTIAEALSAYSSAIAEIVSNEEEIEKVSAGFFVAVSTYMGSQPGYSSEHAGNNQINKNDHLLEIHMEGNSMRQHDYNIFNSNGNNVGCCATAYAVGLSIVTKKAYSPEEFWHDGSSGVTTYYDSRDGHSVGKYQKITGDNAEQLYAKEIINNLNIEDISNGKPTMIHYGYGNGGQHWVLAVGVKPGADPSNATMSDIIIMDPNTGEICGWYERVGVPNTNVWGIQKFY